MTIPSEPNPPFVSVVVPAREAAASIGTTLEAVLSQDYRGGFEIVVAVPAGDPTRAVLERFGESVLVIDNPGVTAPTGLNAALAVASGSVIVRCDAHATLPPGYVSTAIGVLDQSGAEVVGGIQRPVGSTVLQRAVAVAQSTPLGVGDARYRLGGSPGPVDTVYLGVFRREAIDRVGGYAEDLDRNQDYELNHRIRSSGGVVWFDPRLVVDYRPRRRLGDLWSQYFSYGRWKRVVVRRHIGSLRWRQAVAPLLVVALVASAVAAVAGAGAISAAIPAAYLAATVLTGLVEAVRRRDAAALLAPVPLTVMHLAWGLGFLVGVQPPSGPRRSQGTGTAPTPL